MIKIVPNINKAIRITYLILGVALVLTPFLVKLPIATSVLFPVLGLASIATSATGF